MLAKPSDVWREGYEARRDGKPQNANPYKQDSREGKIKSADWRWGWSDRNNVEIMRERMKR